MISVKVKNPEFEGQTKVLDVSSLCSLIVNAQRSWILLDLFLLGSTRKWYYMSDKCLFFRFYLFLMLKTRLGNPEVRRVVDQSLQEHLTEYLELHPDVLDSILSKSLNALKVFLCLLNLV